MRYEMTILETKEVLQLAESLLSFEVTGPFTFYANMKWVRPFGMLLAVSSIKQFRNKHEMIPFSMEYNLTKEGVSYASQMGFFKAISESINVGKEPGEATGNENYIPITELDLKEIHSEEIKNGRMIEIGEAIERKSSELAKILSRDNNELHILFTYLIREMLRNIPEHAECSKALMCGQYWKDGTAEIAIIDEGIGVLGSLQKNKVHKEYIANDEDAIVSALKAGISQAFQPSKENQSDSVWANSGFGLYMVSEICKELNGSFCIASGGKYVNINSDGKTEIGNTHVKGTAIKMMVSTNSLIKSKDIIRKIALQGEEQSKKIRNAFQRASKPSKGLIDNI